MPAFSRKIMALFLHEAYRRFYYCLLLLAIAVVLHRPAYAQKLNKADYFSHGTLVASNRVYEAAIEDFIQEGVGLYTVRTGLDHPITKRFGKNQDLLGGGASGAQGLPGTSYTTIRSYTSKTDYVQSRFAANDSASGFTTVWLDSALCNEDSCLFDPKQYITPIGDSGNPTGYIITYELPKFLAKKPARDQMRITQKINVHGNTFNDSWVEVTTIVKNTGDKTLELGMRYLWDLNIGNDDGPEVFEKVFNTSLGNRERRLDSLDFAFAMARANEAIGTAPPQYNVFASVITPANFLRAPDQPSRLQLVSWPLAFFKAFDYTVHDSLIINTKDDPNARLTGGDNAMQYFWGENHNRALVLSPGDSVQVTQVLLASLDDRPPLFDLQPPSCQLAAINPGPPKSFELVVQDGISGLRLPSVENAFNINVGVPRFPAGSTNPIRVTGTVIDGTKPFGFTLQALDLSGNAILCDPIFLTLLPELRAFEQRFEPIYSDRYFYIKNQGMRRIAANLNGHEFILSAEPLAQRQTRHTFAMPLQGEMTIDMFRYLQEDANTMTIAFDGPEGSRADLVISDMTIKGSVDLVLDLAPVPQQFALSQNLPNPFRGNTTIHFEVPELANHPNGVRRVELKIYNLLGQVLRTLVDDQLPVGSHHTAWDARDAAGREVAAGVYIYDLNADGVRLTKKMALIR
ncbi:hypothetical protein L0337_29065 [candidate division KSB1 bacterium]|nr:hypothetical protein [candidate division KSB1 bacterium]